MRAKVLPASQTGSPVFVSKTVHPLVPPFQSPSFAVATRSSPTQAMESGSRGVAGREPVWSIRPSLTVSIPVIATLPAEKTEVSVLEARSMTAIPLFSWRVTASRLRESIATYSGSGSSGVSIPDAATIGRGAPSASTKRTGVVVHARGSGPRSMICTNPAGSWGRSPFFPPAGVASSSRWFSMATAAYAPSREMAIESGWPPRSIDRTSVRSDARSTSSRPRGLAKSSPVSSITTRT